MNEDEINKYCETFLSTHDCPRVCSVNTKCKAHNMPDSANRIPKGNIGWINYWRAFSGITKDFVPCSCCGKQLSVHKELKTTHDDFIRFIPGMKGYDYAEGGHVVVKGIQGIADGIYITPLCAEHNNLFDQDIEILPGSVLVEEVDPDIVK